MMLMLKVILVAVVSWVCFGCVADRKAPVLDVSPGDAGALTPANGKDHITIHEVRVAAKWKVYRFSERQEMKQLIVDGKMLLRESDWNKDGIIDTVRIRLSDGRFFLIRDTNYDGSFDLVRPTAESK